MTAWVREGRRVGNGSSSEAFPGAAGPPRLCRRTPAASTPSKAIGVRLPIPDRGAHDQTTEHVGLQTRDKQTNNNAPCGM
eukprot:5487999-Pyramimonas_sp.AAC.1